MRDREVYRRAQAKAAAEQREEANPWVQLLARVDAADPPLPGRCRHLVEALRRAWDQLSRTHRPVIYLGYGPQKGQAPRRSLAQLSGMSRRTCQRAVRDLVQLERGLEREWGGGQQPKTVRIRCYNRRSRELVDYGHQRPIGRGGQGHSNGYWTEGLEGPPPAPDLPPEPPGRQDPPVLPPAGPGRGARMWEQAERERRGRKTRGP